jgi:hypothetical protein
MKTRTAPWDYKKTSLAEIQMNMLDLMESAKEQFWTHWYERLERLIELDPDGWEKWYDERPEQTVKEMLPLIEERIKEFEFLTKNADQIGDAKLCRKFGCQL